MWDPVTTVQLVHWIQIQFHASTNFGFRNASFILICVSVFVYILAIYNSTLWLQVEYLQFYFTKLATLCIDAAKAFLVAILHFLFYFDVGVCVYVTNRIWKIVFNPSDRNNASFQRSFHCKIRFKFHSHFICIALRLYSVWKVVEACFYIWSHISNVWWMKTLGTKISHIFRIHNRMFSINYFVNICKRLKSLRFILSYSICVLDFPWEI